MKKVLALVLALVMVAFCFTSCGTKGVTKEQIQKDGKLVMATSPDFPPFVSYDGDNNVVGIEIDIMKLIAEKLGVELQIETMDFDSILPGVQSGKYQCGVDGITITEERSKNVVFTDPYCLAAQSIVVLKGSDIATKADLAGKKVAVQTGTTAELFTRENGYDVSSYTSNNDSEMALVKGKVDAWVIDDLTAADMVKSYNAENGEELVILDEVMTTEPYGFAFQLGSDELVKEINGILAEMQADGTIAGLFAKYDAPFTAPTK